MTPLKLDRRERMGLVLGLLALMLVLALLIYVPRGPRKQYLESISDLESSREELELTRLMKLDQEAHLQGQNELMEQLKARPADFELFSCVDEILRRNGLKERARLENFRARNATPLQPMVRLNLSNVTLKELIDFLYEIYSGKNVIALYQLDRLQPASNRQGLECDLTLVTIKS